MLSSGATSRAWATDTSSCTRRVTRASWVGSGTVQMARSNAWSRARGPRSSGFSKICTVALTRPRSRQSTWSGRCPAATSATSAWPDRSENSPPRGRGSTQQSPGRGMHNSPPRSRGSTRRSRGRGMHNSPLRSRGSTRRSRGRGMHVSYSCATARASGTPWICSPGGSM